MGKSSLGYGGASRSNWQDRNPRSFQEVHTLQTADAPGGSHHRQSPSSSPGNQTFSDVSHHASQQKGSQNLTHVKLHDLTTFINDLLGTSSPVEVPALARPEEIVVTAKESTDRWWISIFDGCQSLRPLVGASSREVSNLTTSKALPTISVIFGIRQGRSSTRSRADLRPTFLGSMSPSCHTSSTLGPSSTDLQKDPSCRTSNVSQPWVNACLAIAFLALTDALLAFDKCSDVHRRQ